MYLHIVPKMHHLLSNTCNLIGVEIPEIDFKIERDSLSTGKPFPNKRILIGMKKGRKSTNGFLIKTNKKINSFTTHFQWEVESMGLISHTVSNYIEDNDYDLVSQDILLNSGFNQWASRIHSSYENLPPVKIQALMESFLSKHRDESHETWIEYDWGKFLLSREESLLLHTIESDRLDNDLSIFERLPCKESVIVLPE